jgi:hypothetical protein
MNVYRSMNVALLAAVVTGLTLCGGCSSKGGKVTVRGEETKAVMAQAFEKAFISSSHDGEYDVLLIQDPASPQSEASKSLWQKVRALSGFAKDDIKPLQPSAASTLRQVVHLHVFWQADGGSVKRDGVVTNAAIDWYVIAHESSDRAEVLRYQGAGYVLLDEGRKSTTVRIRDGSMKKADATSGLQDPFGPAQLAGTFNAQRNSQLVRDTLADLRAQTRPTAVSQAR